MGIAAFLVSAFRGFVRDFERHASLRVACYLTHTNFLLALLHVVLQKVSLLCLNLKVPEMEAEDHTDGDDVNDEVAHNVDNVNGEIILTDPLLRVEGAPLYHCEYRE